MRSACFTLISSLVLAAATPAIAIPSAHHHAATGRVSTRHPGKASTRHTPKLIGQRTIEDERALQIQQALIKAGYLTGTPSGHWDAESIAAMTRLQADNGWQTKLVPDSRALIKLGLGPSPSVSSAPAVASLFVIPEGDLLLAFFRST
jgi:peptidoglycan hydrolase-like protein with peptidoglycan-binding domain